MTAVLWKEGLFLRRKLFSQPRRLFTNLARESPERPPGLLFWPKYFTSEEQRTLLVASLHKLDNLETRQARKKRRDFWNSNPVGSTTTLLDMFAPDELYEFEEARSYQLPRSHQITLPVISIYRATMTGSFAIFEKRICLPGQWKSSRVYNLFWSDCTLFVRHQMFRHIFCTLHHMEKYSLTLIILMRVARGFLALASVMSVQCACRKPSIQKREHTV